MSASNIQNIVSGGSYTAAAGSNRLIVIAVSREASSGTPSVSAMTLGTSTLANGRIIEAATSVKSLASPRGLAGIWYIKEANIQSGAQTLSITWSTTMAGASTLFTVYTLTDRDQSTTLGNTLGTTFDASSDPWPLEINVVANADLVMSAWNSTSGTSFSAPAPWVEDQDVSDTDYRVWNGHLDEATVGDLDATLTLGTARTGSVAIASFRPAVAVTKKLKVLTHYSAAGATDIAGVVFAAPTGGNITGAKIGEFTGQQFLGAEELESGQAVLEVDVTEFDGTSLTSSDTPVAVVRNATYTTGVVSCTVFEE
jgi:hypothetical protein